jgi:RecA-family ATPase
MNDTPNAPKYAKPALRRGFKNPYRPSELPEPPVNDPEVLMGIDMGLLRRLGSLLICGETGLGKSLLALQLATCLVLGRTFFGIPVPRRLRVLMLTAACEDSAEVLWSHFHGVAEAEKFTAEEMALLEENLVFVPVDSRGSSSLEDAALAVKESRIDVVILNPLQHFCDGHPSEINAGFQMVGLLAKLLHESQAALVAIHHVAKPKDQADRGDNWARVNYSGLGAGSFFDFFRSGARLQARGKRGQAALQFTKGWERTGLEQEKIYLEWSKGETFRPGRRTIKHLGWQISTEVMREKKSPQVSLLDTVSDLILKAGASLSQQEIQTALTTAGHKVGDSTLGKRLKAWVEEGVLCSEPLGKRTMYSVPSSAPLAQEEVA